MSDFSDLGQSIFGLAGTALEIGERRLTLEAQNQLDQASITIAQASTRFRDELAKNQDPASWIRDESGGVSGLYQGYRATLEAEVQKQITNPIAKRRIDAILGQYMVADEQFVREEKTKKLRVSLVTNANQLTDQLVSSASTPEERLQVANTRYWETRQLIVDQEGLLTKQQFDEQYAGVIAPYIQEDLEKGIQKAIDFGGTKRQAMEAAMGYIDSLEDIKISDGVQFQMEGYGRDSKGNPTMKYRDGLKAIAAQQYGATVAARNAGYEGLLEENIVNGEWSKVRTTLESQDFEYWATTDTKRYYRALLLNQEAKKDDDEDDEAIKQYKGNYYKMRWQPGITKNELKLVLFQGMALDPDWTNTQLKNLMEESIETDELKGTREWVFSFTKGKNPTMTEAEAGQIVSEISEFQRGAAADLRPGEVRMKGEELMGGLKKDKMVNALSGAATREKIGKGALTLDDFEILQGMIGQGQFDGKLRVYPTKNKAGGLVFNIDGPYAEQLQVMHGAQMKYAAQDFGGEASQYEPDVLRLPEAGLHAGQLIFKGPKGVYTYLMPKGKKDERLHVLGADGWKEVKETPAAAQKANAKRVETEAKRKQAEAKDAEELAKAKARPGYQPMSQLYPAPLSAAAASVTEPDNRYLKITDPYIGNMVEDPEEFRRLWATWGAAERQVYYATVGRKPKFKDGK